MRFVRVCAAWSPIQQAGRQLSLAGPGSRDNGTPPETGSWRAPMPASCVILTFSTGAPALASHTVAYKPRVGNSSRRVGAGLCSWAFWSLWARCASWCLPDRLDETLRTPFAFTVCRRPLRRNKVQNAEPMLGLVLYSPPLKLLRHGRKVFLALPICPLPFSVVTALGFSMGSNYVSCVWILIRSTGSMSRLSSPS